MFGEPSLAVAINLRTKARVSRSTEWSVNGASIDDPKQRYVKSAVKASGKRTPLSIEVTSKIPESSGMGSSAAVTVATLGALRLLDGPIRHEDIARQAFDVEHSVQGRASPVDTSTSTHGHAVLVLKEKGDGFLWRMEREDRQWYLHHREVPPMTFVVGHTGIEAATGPLVASVKEFADRSGEAREMIAEIGRMTLAGVRAIKKKDWVSVGELMDRNHGLLNALGVGHSALDKLVVAARPFSYGAKLTGAGGGGSMIALTDRPAEVADAIEKAGGKPYTVTTGQPGLEATK